RARSAPTVPPPRRSSPAQPACTSASGSRDRRHRLRRSRARRRSGALARPAVGGVPDRHRDLAPDPARALRARARSEHLESRRARDQRRDRRVPRLSAPQTNNAALGGLGGTGPAAAEKVATRDELSQDERAQQDDQAVSPRSVPT